LAVIFLAMMVAPVLAFGPINAENNKNIHSKSATRVGIWTQPTGLTFPNKLGEGVFKRWETVDGERRTLMRLDAAEVNIGNAVDGSEWAFPVGDNKDVCFEILLNAPTRWVYLDTEGYYNMLRGNNYGIFPASVISGWFPEGVYFKADIVGK